MRLLLIAILFLAGCTPQPKPDTSKCTLQGDRTIQSDTIEDAIIEVTGWYVELKESHNKCVNSLSLR